MQQSNRQPALTDAAIARVIARRYGDGGVYIPPGPARRDALKAAISAGFVSQDGFLTRKGRQLVARFES